MTAWLNKRNIKQLVVACNTITVLGTDTIRGSYPFDVIGMAKGSRMVPLVTKNNRVGFFATDFTRFYRSPQTGNPETVPPDPGVSARAVPNSYR